jgi:hypothetical protein
MRPQEVRQGHLFEENNSVHLPPLQKAAEEQVTRELVHWMRALAKVIGGGVRNEQDKR